MSWSARRVVESRLPPVPRWLAVIGSVTLIGGTALVVFSWLVTVVAHLDDGYAVDHVSGTWIALARYANDGTFYPPLYDGETFGGTRFMPIPIVVQAAAAQLSGEFLVSAKVISAVLALCLAALTFVLLRRRCPLPVALALSSTLLVTGTGLVASTSIRNDVLPLVLQLGALALVASSTSRHRVVAAGVLCAVAIMGKLSALWAPIAIVVWLARRDRRRLPAYAAAFVGAGAVALLVFQLASQGRLTDNLLELSTTDTDRFGSFGDVRDRVRLIVREGLGLLVVLPLLAVLGTAVAVRRREVGLYHFAFVAALLVTAAVLVDPGAYVNHLLDVQVLALLVIGELWRHLAPVSSRSLSWATLAIAAALVVGSAAAYRQNMSIGRDLGVLVEGTADRDRVPRLAGAVEEDDRVLSEDPFVPASRGIRPVVLDPYMLITLLRGNPEWRRDLVARIEDAEFDKIVLFYLPQEARQWYERVHLGAEVVRAVERRYKPTEQIDGYWIYVPR